MFTIVQKSMPRELNKFNWGAFLLTWIWAIGNRAYLAIIPVIIPMIFFRNYILCSILASIALIINGIYGNRWAWNAKDWQSVEEFNNAQRGWAIIGVAINLIIIGAMIFIVAILI